MTEEATAAGEQSKGDLSSTLIGFAVVAAIGGGLFFTFGPFGGSTLGRIEMQAEPRSIEIEVEDAGTLQVWADVEITHRGISPNIPAKKLPHVIDYVVELSGGDGEPRVQRCNPFASNVMRRSDVTNSVGKAAGRRYDGLVQRCGFTVQPGSYTVTAHIEAVDPDSRVSLQKNELVLRLD